LKYGNKAINREIDSLRYNGWFSGRKGVELKHPKYQSTINSRTEINSRLYTGHALDSMQNRGIMPSVVEEAILKGSMQRGKSAGTIRYYHKKNNISVIVNERGDVVTTTYGNIKQ